MASFLTQKQVDQMFEWFKQLPFTHQSKRDDRAVELKYLVEERLGILCGKDAPTTEQRARAEHEANQWLDLQANLS